MNNHIGGSNIEFEEKAMNIIAGIIGGSGYSAFPGAEKLTTWSENFVNSRDNFTNIILTQEEKDAWFEALEEFRIHNMNLPGLYGTPIDSSLLPNSLLNLWSMSDCNYQL